MGREAQRQGLGHRGEERRRQVPAHGEQELERLVERERVGSVRARERGGIEELAHRPRRAVAASAGELEPIAPDRVDLAVVGDVPEWLGETPHGRRVRRVALVERRVSNAPAGGEVGEELREPIAGYEALVHDRSGGSRRDAQLVEAQLPGRGFEPASSEDKAALEGGGADARGPADDRLGDVGPARGCLGAEGSVVHRDRAPSRDRQARGGERGRNERAGPSESRPTAGQEQLDDRRSIPTEAGSEVLGDVRVQRQRYAGTVARFAVRGECPAVPERGQPGEGEGQDPVARSTTGIRDEPDAARIVLEARVVEGWADGRAAVAPGLRAGLPYA